MLVLVPVVGVVRIPGPASTQDLKEASSSLLIVGTRNNNKRKESTRIREVCSSCQFFLAKQRYFYLARRVSKFRTNLSNTKVN